MLECVETFAQRVLVGLAGLMMVHRCVSTPLRERRPGANCMWIRSKIYEPLREPNLTDGTGYLGENSIRIGTD